jgi:FlaG/FlaF family flagellin (archaellin)
MWIMGRHYNNKAVSQVIAALLLIAISVAAAVLVYVFSIGLLGSLQSGGGQQAKQQVIMEAYNWNDNTTLSLTVRNVGPANVQIVDGFINGVKQEMTPTATTINVGSSAIIKFDGLTSGYNNGVSYVIKLVTIDGAVFSYSAIAGSAS